MSRKLFQYILSLLLITYICPSLVLAEVEFGYMSYHTINIGDDIQSIAAKRFLPKNCTGIDRESIGVFNQNIKAIVNGWYMHTTANSPKWHRPFVRTPEECWPPSPTIDPLLISIHFTKAFLPFAFSQDGVEYLKKHGPVGARDYHTLT